MTHEEGLEERGESLAHGLISAPVLPPRPPDGPLCASVVVPSVLHQGTNHTGL